MSEKYFSIDESIKFGWAAMKNNIGFFIGLLVISGLIFAGVGIVSGIFESFIPAVSPVMDIVTQIIWIIVTMGLMKIAIRFAGNEKGEFSELFSCAHLFLKYAVSSILYFLIIFGGMLLLVVPGIIWAIKFNFYGYLIVDRGLGPVEALKKSSEMTDGVKWDLFVLGILVTLINILGALCFGIGLFATIPTTMVAVAFVYRKLLSRAENREAAVESTVPERELKEPPPEKA